MRMKIAGRTARRGPIAFDYYRITPIGNHSHFAIFIREKKVIMMSQWSLFRKNGNWKVPLSSYSAVYYLCVPTFNQVGFFGIL